MAIAKHLELSVCIPVYNRHSNLNEIYDNLVKEIEAVGFNRWQLVLIDDSGKKPEALHELLRFKKLHPEVRIIRLNRNFGQSIALQYGLNYATGDIVFILDDDMVRGPEMLHRFLKEMLDKKHDVVYGINSKRATKFRSGVLSWFLKVMSIGKHKPHRAGSSIRLIKSEVLGKINLKVFDRILVDVKFYDYPLSYGYVPTDFAALTKSSKSGYSFLQKVALFLLLLHLNSVVSEKLVRLTSSIVVFIISLFILSLILQSTFALWVIWAVFGASVVTTVYLLAVNQLILTYKKRIPESFKTGIEEVY